MSGFTHRARGLNPSKVVSNVSAVSGGICGGNPASPSVIVVVVLLCRDFGVTLVIVIFIVLLVVPNHFAASESIDMTRQRHTTVENSTKLYIIANYSTQFNAYMHILE